MDVRLTDLDLLKLIADFRAVDADPHQDYGDVGFLIAEVEDHLLLEELVAARAVVAAARLIDAKWAIEAVRVYDALFDAASDGSGD